MNNIKKDFYKLNLNNTLEKAEIRLQDQKFESDKKEI